MENSYKSIPFWSWNNRLDKAQLSQQILDMKKSQIGGFFIHARAGLKTPYLSQEWLSCVGECISTAKANDMDVWIYDENGWPSGFIGGKLLEKEANKAHYITMVRGESFDRSALANYIIVGEELRYTLNPIDGESDYVIVYDNVSQSNTDILNGEVVRQFIGGTHEVYYKHFQQEFGKTIKGFFIDEPQYYRDDTPYSTTLPDVFMQKYGISLIENIGLLFVDCSGAYAFRYKYWKTLQELFLQNFVKQVYDWCDSHNVMLTGHGCEESYLYTQMWCCGGVMPMYEYFHIPGVDWLGNVIGTELCPKQLSSVTAQLNKKFAITETFGCSGWDITPSKLKHLAEWQYVNGVNKMCQHLYPYSIEGQAKRDYPTHFSEHSPWFSKFGEFNEYFNNLGYTLANSVEVVRVGVIHPMSSCYLTYNRQNDYNSVKDIEDSFSSLIEQLGEKQIFHHYIDETILSKYGRVEDAKIAINACEYDIIILPYLTNLASSTTKVLSKYCANGGKICVYGDTPKYLEGAPHNFDFLVSNISLDEIVESMSVITSANKNIRSTLRRNNDGEFLYVVNLSDSETEVNIAYKNQKSSRYLRGYQSDIIPLYDFKSSDASRKCNFNLTGQVTLPKKVSNYLTLDKLSISADGVNFSEKQYFYKIFEQLMYQRKRGKMFLRYDFDVVIAPQKIKLVCENMGIIATSINGNAIKLALEGMLDKKFLSADIADYVVIGKNYIDFEIDFVNRDELWQIMFDKTVTESLKNSICYDTCIESVYLVGEFGVFAKSCAEDDDFVLANDFFLSEQKSELSLEEFEKDGYYFFAGDITFKKVFDWQYGECLLNLRGNACSVEIVLNGEKIPTSLFDDCVLLTDFVREKDNELIVTLTISNRNLLGAHHYKHYKNMTFIGPYQFSLQGEWTCGDSPNYIDEYVFRKLLVAKR